MSTFSVVGTARHYKCAIKFACNKNHLDVSWGTGLVQTAIDGVKRDVMMAQASVMLQQCMLAGAVVEDVVLMADMALEHSFATQMLVG